MLPYPESTYIILYPCFNLNLRILRHVCLYKQRPKFHTEVPRLPVFLEKIYTHGTFFCRTSPISWLSFSCSYSASSFLSRRKDVWRKVLSQASGGKTMETMEWIDDSWYITWKGFSVDFDWIHDEYVLYILKINNIYWYTILYIYCAYAIHIHTLYNIIGIISLSDPFMVPLVHPWVLANMRTRDTSTILHLILFSWIASWLIQTPPSTTNCNIPLMYISTSHQALRKSKSTKTQFTSLLPQSDNVTQQTVSDKTWNYKPGGCIDSSSSFFANLGLKKNETGMIKQWHRISAGRLDTSQHSSEVTCYKFKGCLQETWHICIYSAYNYYCSKMSIHAAQMVQIQTTTSDLMI